MPPKLEILYDNYYYDVTDWVRRHPGGNIIQFYTKSGVDASIAIKQFHHRSEKKVMNIMKSFSRRLATEGELSAAVCTVLDNDSDSKPLRNYEALTEDFMHLYHELMEEGMFTSSILNTILRILEIILLISFGLYFTPSENILLKTLGIICLVFYVSRGCMLTHEAGHRSLTGNVKIDKIIQVILQAMCLGFSASYWSSQHNRHHAMPQRINHDIDLETMPLMAFNTRVVRDRKHGKSFFVRNQVLLFFTIDTFLIVILWKCYLHPKYALHKGCYGELLIMAAHYIIMYIGGFWNYLLVLWLGSIHMLGTFMLSHSHLPVTTESKHWVEFSLDHTMNTHGSPFYNWWTGYLNYQIEHHLFPTIPNFRLPQIAPRVKVLAAKHGIPYQCVSYSKAILLSINNLYQVSKELNTKI